MNITKSGVAQGGAVSPGEMERVNAFAKTKLTGEEVYLFSVLLCDNEVDRDFERFTEETLRELEGLFVGKTGIFDHEWSAGNQTARIYRTELVTDAVRRNSLGAPYVYLKGWAYMLRLPGNEALIAEIDGGIKRETSVGCAVKERRCSVCGGAVGACGHVPGTEYDGKMCHAELCGAADAYEWSFVAVPAQKNAGVCKALGAAGGFGSLKQFVASAEGARFAPELEALEKSAELGRRYLAELREETLRLSLVCDKELHGVLEPVADSLDETALLGLKKSLEKRAEARFSLQTQLPGREETVDFQEEEYQI